MAVGAYGWWAVVTPLYYRIVDDVPVGELLAWRVLSGIPAMWLLLAVTGRLGEVWRAIRTPRVLGLLAVSSVLIAINWVVFVWAVIDNRLSEASLGYYINPLVWVALGTILLGERMRLAQWIAVGLAGVGVAVLAWRLGGVPWISLTLACSFALYGLTRKQVAAAPAAGLAVEMLLLSPFMLALMWWGHVEHGNAAIAGPWWVTLLLLAGGVVTLVPLVLFAGGARRLQLTTMGVLQYISPTGQLLLAVIAFNEPFGVERVIAFGFIWAAVITYSADSLRHARAEARIASPLMDQ
ncbi:MAG: EamA family transporter RarD [Phycisphaerales bacterium]|jgi:chloramphenicol-sensitive protein RarD|nr:EamA family transporter RarD [Phycisphaerales bacterium]